MSARIETSDPGGQIRPSDIEAAAAVLESRLRRTPVLLDDDIVYKLELLQHSGTFKARGATHALIRAIDDGEVGGAGVVAASGGNHGAAVAWAARELGVPANIFVPTISSPTKVDRLLSYGATVHQIGDVYAESLAASEAFIEDNGGFSVHAYEDPIVVMGAGTCAMEMEQDAGSLDVVFVSCGGGGLAAGTAAWFDGRTELVICETETTNAFAASVAADSRVEVEVSGIAADALGATSIGELAWDILRHSPTTSVVVSDEETITARQWVWDRFRLLIEHSAAVAVAAHHSGRFDTSGKRVGIIVCGANTSL
ncbi:MAG: serine/threonine dehydratase [Acidimicrobiales bacterium]